MSHYMTIIGCKMRQVFLVNCELLWKLQTPIKFLWKMSHVKHFIFIRNKMDPWLKMIDGNLYHIQNGHIMRLLWMFKEDRIHIMWAQDVAVCVDCHDHNDQVKKFFFHIWKISMNKLIIKTKKVTHYVPSL